MFSLAPRTHSRRDQNTAPVVSGGSKKLQIMKSMGPKSMDRAGLLFIASIVTSISVLDQDLLRGGWRGLALVHIWTAFSFKLLVEDPQRTLLKKNARIILYFTNQLFAKVKLMFFLTSLGSVNGKCAILNTSVRELQMIADPKFVYFALI